MKILLLTTDAYGGHGGIALYNRDITEALANMSEVEEIIVLPRNQPLPLEPIPDKVKFISKASGKKWRYIKEALRYSTKKYDLVICGHINLLPLAVILNIWIRARLVLMVYGIDVWKNPYHFAKKFLKNIDEVWSISQITFERMQNWVGKLSIPHTLLPNAIHLDRYGISEKSKTLKEKYKLQGRVIMTLARLPEAERYKGVDEILEVMSDLIKEYPDLMYLIVGDGNDRARLETKAKTLGIDKHVAFTGFINESEKTQHFQLADVFAMPGRGEGFGFVFLEALACGIPVVGSQIDGSREALRGGELGELVDPCNLESIKQGIQLALAKPKIIPDGLNYFAWPAFQKRLHQAIKNHYRHNIT